MKVVSRGTPPGDEVFRGICTSCRSVMEEQASRLTVQHGDQREPGRLAQSTCPVCGASFWLYPKKHDD